MKTFTIGSDLEITAFATKRAAITSGDPEFATVEEMDGVFKKRQATLVEIWNSIPGLTPVKKFMDRKTGLNRIWKQIQSLEALPDLPEVIEAEPAAKPAKKARQTKAQNVPTNGAQTAHTPREGSKGAEVADMLRRANGATLDEIMQATGWQKHTVRGFIAGAAKKKLGLNIESFKNENGDRSYKVVA